MTYSCIIVDDEPKAQQLLSDYLELLPYMDLLTVCWNAFEALEFLQGNRVDLIFLDIKMPQFTGVELARAIGGKTKIIMTTAYTDYAIEGFELGVVDYLIKPFPFQRFVKAVQRAFEIPVSSSHENTTNQEDAFVIVQLTGKKVEKVYLDSIHYLEAYGNYVKIYQTDGNMVIAQESMKAMEKSLPYNRFVRIHRSHIICLDKVQSFTETKVNLKNREFSIGRIYRKVFSDRINN